MARGHVEGVTGLDDLLVIRIPDSQAAGGQITPVRALAAVAREALEHRSEVGILSNGGEVHGIAVEVVGPVLGHAVVDDLGGTLA